MVAHRSCMAARASARAAVRDTRALHSAASARDLGLSPCTPLGFSARALKVDLNLAWTSTTIYLKALHLASAPQARLGSRRVAKRQE